MTITIRCVFEEDGKLYPQVYLDDSLYELNLQKMLVMFCKFFFIVFLGLIKMSEITDLTYYKKTPRYNINKAKDYYKNNKEKLNEQARDKCKSLSKEEKNKKREYGKNRYHNMSEEKKEAIKEKSRNHYKTLSPEEKDKNKEYQRKMYQELLEYKKEALKNK